MSEESRTQAAFDFRESMARGVSWTVVAQMTSRFLQFGVTAILARLLLPAHFGLAGMALMVTGFLSVFCELGMHTAVVHKKDADSAAITAAFIAVNAAGLLLAVLCLGLADLIAMFFRDPAVAPVLRALALTMPIWSLGVVHSALLVRDMRFDHVGATEVSGSIAYGVVALTLAAMGAGVWSLVGGNLALAVAKALAGWALCPWRPNTRPDFRKAAEMFSYGYKVLGTNVFGYFRQNVDYLIIGRFMGAAPLGIYTIAFRIAEFPKKNLTSIVSAVAFPAFVKLQDHKEQLRYSYLRTIRLMALYVAPVLVGVAVLARPFILTVYGDKWAAAILPLQLLVCMGLLLSMSDLGVSLILSLGDAKGQLRFSLTYASTVGVLAFAAVPLGINGVAAAVLVGTAAFFLLVQMRVFRLLVFGWGELGSALMPAVVGSLAIVLSGSIVLVLTRAWQPPLILAVGAAAGALAYLVSLRLLGVDEVWRTVVRGKQVLAHDLRAKVANRSIRGAVGSDAE